MQGLWLVFLSLVATPAFSQPTTYVLQSAPYLISGDFTPPCGTGPCANFPTGFQPSGFITLSVPLPPNLAVVEVSSTVISFQFSDGINVYDSADPDIRLTIFEVTTNATGDITSPTRMDIDFWKTGSNPHVSGDRLSSISVLAGGQVEARHNYSCGSVGVSPASGVVDTCIVNGLFDFSQSSATASSSAWTRPAESAPVPVPVLAPWALTLLGLLVGGLAPTLVQRGRRGR